MQEEIIKYQEREKQLEELFDRTKWIFEDGDAKSMKSRQKPEIYMPDGIDVLRTPNELDIQVNWRKNVTLTHLKPLLFFTALWNIMVFMIVMGIMLSGGFVALLFVGIHGLAGFGMMYNILALMFNHTNIQVRDQVLTITNQKFFNKIHKDHRIPSTDIKQFYVIKKRNGSVNGVPNYAYHLMLLLKSGEKISLIRGLNHESLLFLEQEFETYLNLDDVIMKDEVRYTENNV